MEIRQLRVVPSEVEHLFMMADRIHEGNEAEAEALAGVPALELLNRSIETSKESWTVVVNETPVAIYGIGTVSKLTGCATPWLVCTEDIRTAGITFLRHFRRAVEGYKEKYKRLKCLIYHENTEVMRMMEWIGFRKERDVRCGLHNEIFHEMVWDGDEDVP